MAAQDQPYDIQIPGLQDIIRIPALESVELKRERIRRWKTHQSAIPDFLHAVPAMINYLDDAQDALITGLGIARWLAPKLLARALPGLGWALLANDVLNLGSLFLAMTMTGPAGKNRLLQQFFRSAAGRAARVANAEAFLKHGIHWLPFTLQAGQTLKSVTGYGLQLGGVMGAVSDGYWSLWRGNPHNVKIVGPPQNDILSKVSRLFAQNPIVSWMSKALDAQEWAVTTLARKAITAFAGESAFANKSAARSNELAQTPYPQPQVWSESSKAALHAEGFPVREDTPSPFEHLVDRMTAEQATRMAWPLGSDQDTTMAKVLPPGDASNYLGTAAIETAEDLWGLYGLPEAVTPLLTAYERLLGIAQHHNIRPPFGVPNPGADSTLFGIPPGQPIYFDRNVRWWEPRSSHGFRPDRGDVRFIPMFPQTDRPIEYQLGTWCRVALRINCEAWRPDVSAYIAGGTFAGPAATGSIYKSTFASALLMAAVLVWGNAWRLTPYVDPGQGTRPRNQRRCCNLDRDGKATLSGDASEWRASTIDIPQPAVPPITQF